MGPRSEVSDESNYDVPETFLNLDEVASPEPVQHPPVDHGLVFRDSSEHSHSPTASNRQSAEVDLEPAVAEPSIDIDPEKDAASSAIPLPRRDSWGNVNHLTEEVVPPPVSRQQVNPRRSLERRLSRTERDTVDSSIWQSAQRKKASKMATEFYTVCYLILFSILGTLARLGLQALCSYPGSQITTPVVWANFAGSLIMGFLAEDRNLFKSEWGEKERRKKYSTKRERRAQKQQEKELVSRSQRYSRTENAPTPFTNKNTANLYPVRRVHVTGRGFPPPSIPEQSEGSVISASTATHLPYTSEEKKRHGTVKKTIPLYIGLATGFCGSLTSFSAFMRDTFLALSNSNPSYPTSQNGFSTLPEPRSGGFSFLSLLAVLIYEPALSIAALFIGAHIALALDPYIPALPFRFVRKVLDRVAAVLAIGFWLAAIIMAGIPPDRPGGPASSSHSKWASEYWRVVILPVVFAPFGCLMRFYISMLLNSRLPSFPLGTFTVNIFGTLLMAMFYDLQRARLKTSLGLIAGGGRVGCQVLQGMIDGFCGALTTVSTWVAELNGLKRKNAWIYGLSSALVGLCCVIVVMGPLKWTVGFAPDTCGV